MTGYGVVSILAAAFIQHIVHECGHILVARSQGVRVRRVQWFTYSGAGTRVFYENEPSLDQDRIEPRWGLIALGGLVSTTLVGYLLILVYQWGLLSLSAWSVSVLFFGSVIFLVTDPLYFLLGALFGFGDVLGVMKVFRVTRPKAGLISVIPLLLAGFTIAQVWYR